MSFARSEDNICRAAGAGSAGGFRPSIMLNASIIARLGGCHADPASLRPVHRASACRCARRGRRSRGPPLRRPADADAGMECPGRARDRSSLRPGAGRHPRGRMAVLRALRQGDQRAQARAQRGHPGAQLPDAGNLQLRRRFRRGLAPARARRPRSMPRSSSNAACISWPRRRKSSTPTRPC